MSALKPLGRSAKDFGETAYKLALGGCPLIKDDHSLFNQSYAPFKDRVKACVDSVNNANAKTGGRSLYIANCTADSMEFLERAMTAQELGAGGIMAAPGLLGLSIIRELSSAPDFHLPIFLHPCFSGSLVLSADSGISPSAATASSAAWQAPMPPYSPASADAFLSPKKYAGKSATVRKQKWAGSALSSLFPAAA